MSEKPCENQDCGICHVCQEPHNTADHGVPGHVVLPVEDVRQAVEALDAALEWAAKYPLQGEPSPWDMGASEHVYALTDSILSTLRKHLEGQSR